jgi:hypothetical protein
VNSDLALVEISRIQRELAARAAAARAREHGGEAFANRTQADVDAVIRALRP